MSSRIERDTLYMSIASLISKRGTCLRAEVGCIAVSDGRIIANGYVGSLPRDPHCLDVGCQIGDDEGCSRTVHAEANMIAFSAKHGLSLNLCDVYSTHSPCPTCAKLLVSCGIFSITYSSKYRIEEGITILEDAGVEVNEYGSKA